MAKMNWKGWIALDGLSNDAIKAAAKEIGVERLNLGKAGDAKARREIKSIADKWAKKFPVAKDESPSTPQSGAKPKAEAKPPAPAKAEAPPSEPKPKAKAKPKAAPKSEPKPKAAPKSEKPKSGKAKKAKPKAAPKSEVKPAPKSEPKSAKKAKPAPKSEKPKSAKAKKGKRKASGVTEAMIKELQAQLVTKLAELRVSCPGERAHLMEDAAAVLATARAVAMVSPEVRRARNELQSALESFAGYTVARDAVAAAEKSVPVREAKAHVKAVMAEQISERERQILEDAEQDPRVIAARAALAAARSPETVQKAMANLSTARDHCRRSARALRETYGGQIDKLRADLAATGPLEVAPAPGVIPTAEQLLFGPRTVASARAS